MIYVGTMIPEALTVKLFSDLINQKKIFLLFGFC